MYSGKYSKFSPLFPSPSPSPVPSPAFSVVFYHLGCYAEYKLGLKDTARVVPVHGVCGLWSLIAIGVFQTGGPARCNLHAAFEGLCYCHLRLPSLVSVVATGTTVP